MVPHRTCRRCWRIMIKLIISDLSEVAESHRNLYRPRGDGAPGYILDVEGGVVARSVHDEFRANNVALLKRLKDASDTDPEAVAQIRAENEKLKTDLTAARKGASADAEARIAAMEKTSAGFRQRLENVLIDQQVARIAVEVGAHPTALDDISTRVRSRFRLGDDGQPVAVDASGNRIFGDDGKPLGVEGAVRQLTAQAPHLFRSSSGGGAAHTSTGGGRFTTGQLNPFKKESLNLTDQSRLIKTNRPEAERLAAEAGVSLPA